MPVVDLSSPMAADTRPNPDRVCYYFIRSNHSNLILDVEDFGQTHAAGSRVTTWLAKDWSDQLWYDDPSTGTIRWKKNGFCLDLKDDGDAAAAAVAINPYREGRSSQLWKRDGPFIRRSQQPDQVIDIANGSLMPGAEVVVHPFDGRHNQQFDFVQIPGLDEPYSRRYFFIESAKSRQVLDVQQERTAPGTGVIIYRRKPKPAKNQLWFFDAQGIIRTALNDFVLESQYGRPLRIMPYSSMACQEWTLVDGGILSKTGECLEIAGGSRQSDGTQISSAKFYGSDNQLWRLEFV